MDTRKAAIGVLTLIVVGGTLFSIQNKSYLDTSNPLIAHLPHPLATTHYFASKSNPLNTVFIKRAWGWTSTAFALLISSSPRPTSSSRLTQYAVLTVCWLLFTSWFFGPALIDRFLILSGGQCVIVPPGSPPITVPAEFCHARTPVSMTDFPALFAGTLDLNLPSDWRAMPRLRRGHDVSGHIFLLAMSILFLVDQLRFSFRSRVVAWTSFHRAAIAFNVTLILIWLFATYTTSLYFHSPMEKFSGLAIGLASYALSVWVSDDLDEHDHTD